MEGRTEPEDAEDIKEADLNGRASGGDVLHRKV